MADSEVGDLTAAGALTGAELVHIVQSGNSRKTTTQDLANVPGGTTVNTRGSSNYTLVLADANTVMLMNNGGPTDLVVPPNASVAFPIGTFVEVHQQSAGVISVVAGAGVTIKSSGALLDSSGLYAVMGLRKIATNEWVLTGDIA